MKLSRMDRLALLNSEVFCELEDSVIKQAQTLADKIVQSPTAQKAITDGISRALENKADDWDEEHESIRANIKKLDDHVLFEFFKMFADEIERREIDTVEYEKEFEETEKEENDEDELAEEEEMSEVFAFVKNEITKMAHKAADSGDTKVAYTLERFIQKIS